MKRIALIALLALALPMAGLAGGVDFVNTGGTLAGSSAGLSLSGSSLTSVIGLGSGTCSTASPCGSVSFTTGSLISGNLTTGATFGSSGSSFQILGNGTDGLPPVIFSGSFVGYGYLGGEHKLRDRRFDLLHPLWFDLRHVVQREDRKRRHSATYV